MGLLDGLFSDDPQKQAMMAMALGLLQGAPQGRKNFGADLSNAGLLGMQTYGQAKTMQQKMAEEKQQQQLRDIQLKTAQRGFDDSTLARNLLMGGEQQGPQMPAQTPQAQAIPAPGGKGPAIASQASGGNSKFDTFNKYNGIAERLEQNGLIDQARTYRDLAEKFRPEIKETKTLVDPQSGQRVTVNIYKDGTTQVVPFSPDMEKAHFADTGSAVVPVNPFTGQPIGAGLNKTVTPGESLSANVTMRGQNMTDARSRESQDFARQQAAEGKIPSGYRAGPNGLEFIPGGPADPRAGKPTDTERVASGYYDRMASAEKIMQPIESTAGKPGIRESVMMAGGGAGEMAANALPEIMGGRSADRQSYRQAQEDWVRAKLRKESGAVIAKEEMAQEIRTYFPQVGDSAQVVAQKANARKIAANSMKTAAGPVANDSLQDLIRKYTGK